MACSPEAPWIPLTGAGLDRAAHRRRDAAWIATARASARARILVMRGGALLVDAVEPTPPSRSIGADVAPGHPLRWLSGELALDDDGALFLGEDESGAPVFAIELADSAALDDPPLRGLGVFEDFRVTATGLGAFDGGAAATARAMFEWHRHHRHCSRCGAPSRAVDAGWKRSCDACRAEHFPRTDPVVIMLAVRDARCLLGRQRTWAPGLWSCLAGFVEPGETLEQAAAREVLEETGIRCGRAEYLFGQPWPFPSSLMLGLLLEAHSDRITVDDELEDARWFNRDEAIAMLERTHPTAFAPPRFAVAHHVLRAWIDRTAAAPPWSPA
jgi:NAD+ diphosphatase